MPPKPSGWNNDHHRMNQLPRDWHKRRQAVIARDGGACQLCGRPGRDVDHINRGDNHNLANLRLLCRRCHMQRTGRDGGQTKRKPKRRTHRPSTPHPGLKLNAKRTV